MSTRALAVILAVLVSLPLIAAGRDIPTLVAGYGNPTLGAASTVSNVPIRISNLSLQLSSGSMAPVMAGDEQVGIFFRGAGTFSYRSTDPTERALVLFEAKKLDRTHEKAEDGTVTVSGSFERLYLLTGGIELPSATSPSSESLEQAFRAHREQFANVRWTPPSHLLIRQRRDEPTAQVAVAEISGKDHQAYVLDTIDTKSECLYALITKSGLFNYPELRGALFPIPIAEQPVGRSRTAFVQPRYLLADIDYTLVAGEKAAGKLTVTETIVPRTGPQSTFRFNLHSGVWDTEWKYRPVRVDDVRDAAGEKLPYHHDNDSVLVGLPSKAPANEPVTIRFEISGDFLYRPDNDSYWQLHSQSWFPQPELNGRHYTIHSIVKVKKPWVAFATGDLVARTEEGDYNVYENAIDKPVIFAVVHAGKYTVFEEKFDGLTVRIAPYAGINDGQVKQLARLSSKIIKFYEPWLGPFPFKEFNIIEMNDYAWGQAPPGMMFITKEAFNPLIDTTSRYFSKGANHRFAHEIAHQYWGTVVRMGSDEEQWLSESFAEFCSALVVKEIEGQRGYDSMVASWRVNAKEAGDFAPIALANRISIPNDPDKAFEHRFGLMYSKGAYVLAALRQQVGDQKFFSWLRNLQGQFAWRFLTTPDAAKLLQRIDGGKDHQPFFDRYVWGTELPQISK